MPAPSRLRKPKQTQVITWMPPAMHVQIKKEAKRLGISASALIRNLFEGHQRGGKGVPPEIMKEKVVEVLNDMPLLYCIHLEDGRSMLDIITDRVNKL